MDQAEFDRVAASFAAFHAEFAPLFGRKEAQRRSEQHVRGLLLQQTDRRNAENVAEMIVGATPRTLQRLLTEAPWPTEPVIDRLQAYLGARLNTPEGIFVLDESGFPKQGRKSVGVVRQYCGTLGKVGNCQLGVFLSYVSARGQAVAASLPPTAWQDLTVAEGAHGPRTYQFVALRVWESRDGLPGRACWLLLRRNLDGRESRYYLSNAPEDTPLLTLAQVAAARWVIETEFETAKGETGLDEYEVRSWAGWHHHITLALLAATFLLTLQQDWGEKDAPDHAAPSQPAAAGGAAAAYVDTRRPTPVAPRHPRAQRARQTVPHQAAPPPAA